MAVASFFTGRAGAPGDGPASLPDTVPEATSLDEARTAYGYDARPTLGNRKNDRDQAREALALLIGHGTSSPAKVSVVGNSLPRDEDSPNPVEYSDPLFSGTVNDGGYQMADLVRTSGPHRGRVS